MEPTLPTWFKMRQAKAEAAGTDALRLTAPNQNEAFISIRQGETGRWAASLRVAADGPELASTAPEFERPEDAWGAAFELYRRHLLV